MSTIKPGTRVVRGPDWISKNQDNGEGFLGTLIFVPKQGSSDSKVTVIWDSGREMRYRAGQDGKYDLRVYDTAPTGVIHKTIICDGCGENRVRGMRWKCTTCEDFDLCTTCYMKDEHDITHTFVRIDTEKSTAFAVPSRANSRQYKKEAFGILPGAEVMRGPHWKWKNDDGDDGEVGIVQTLETWESSGYRGCVEVKWKQNPDLKRKYRVGAEGRVDVIYTSRKKTASGGYYYRDHLPLVDVVNPGEIILKPGDKVIVNLTLQAFKQLQDNSAYGGWNDGMIQCTKEIGTIVAVLFEGKTIILQYGDARKWTVNRASITRKHTFSVGEVVRVISDINAARDLQDGHGGWNKQMESALGKAGRIIKIDSDGDMTLKIAGKMWIFSPVCLSLEEDQAIVEQMPKLTESERAYTDASSLSVDTVAEAMAQLFVNLLKARSGDESAVVSIVQAAGEGDLDVVRSIVKSSPEKIDSKVDGKTALQVSSFQGEEDVVRFLLENKADVNLVDKEGDTALHYSAFGQEEATMKILLECGAKINALNQKKQTALHISVGKKTVECVKVLVKSGASCTIKDESDDTVMHDAVLTSDDDIINLILNSKQTDFTVSNSKGFNVLQWATFHNSLVGVEAVIGKNKSVVNSQTAEGFTAMHIACANGYVEIASVLLTKGKCDVNTREKRKRTPLMMAVSRGHKRTMELLLKTTGIDVNAQDMNGNSALHIAQHTLPTTDTSSAGTINTEIICSLVEAKANIALKNNDDNTPLDLAPDQHTKNRMQQLAQSVKRKTLATTMTGHRLPSHWQLDTEPGIVVKRVPLSQDDAMMKSEWDQISNKFLETMPQASIQSIERVQNGYLWETYALKKKDMERRYGPGCANELQLYHGTKADLVDTICHQSFDFRLSGERTGTLFGKGAYFASTAKYSDLYATRGSSGNKYLFVAKCLVGKYTSGKSSYVRPPAIDPSDHKKGLYDCCVDNPNNPTIYCIFDNNQFYPEYIVEYA